MQLFEFSKDRHDDISWFMEVSVSGVSLLQDANCKEFSRVVLITDVLLLVKHLEM